MVDARQQESSLYRHEHDASGLGLVSTSASLHLTVAAVIAGVMILLVVSNITKKILLSGAFNWVSPLGFGTCELIVTNIGNGAGFSISF